MAELCCVHHNLELSPQVQKFHLFVYTKRMNFSLSRKCTKPRTSILNVQLPNGECINIAWTEYSVSWKYTCISTHIYNCLNMVLVKGKLYGFNMYCDQAVRKNRSMKERHTYVLKTEHLCMEDRYTSLHYRGILSVASVPFWLPRYGGMIPTLALRRQNNSLSKDVYILVPGTFKSCYVLCKRRIKDNRWN